MSPALASQGPEALVVLAQTLPDCTLPICMPILLEALHCSGGVAFCTLQGHYLCWSGSESGISKIAKMWETAWLCQMWHRVKQSWASLGGGALKCV